MVIAERPTIRVREIAAATGVTERSVQRIIGDLEAAGFVRHERVGRRNRYIVDATCRSGHPLESEVDVEQLAGMMMTDLEEVLS